ncbi:MAG: transketolase C-terminal domain-containing protein [Bacilli bacterium]|nr:transketolase C-terminal domain-containing protein [Bacilli bacterium]
MRNMVVKTIHELAKNDNKLYLITGDLGFGVLTKFWEDYPKQFINAGIAEQNMTSVAAGMALEGNKIFTYSIANFPTLRCLEQIRNDVAYHNANVKIVSIGAGFAYGSAGMSHHATEDLAIMRALPEMVVFSPADPIEAGIVTKLAYNHDGPCYLRIGKGGEDQIHPENLNFKIGEAIKIKKGDDIVIFSTGAITSEALKAIEILKKQKIIVGLYSFPTIKPIDEKVIIECSEKMSLIITLEEHNKFGGFGGAVAEIMAENRGKSRLKRIGLDNQYACAVGNQNYLRDYYDIDSKKIVDVVLDYVRGVKK